MKYRYILIWFFCFSILSINAQENIALLDEYKLLCTDLMNINTSGYKSYFDDQTMKANSIINISQGALLWTENSFNFAIEGEGFFKIRLENNLIGYTRAGEFVVDSDGELITSNGYSFFHPIILINGFIADSLRITMDRYICIKSNEIDNDEEIIIGIMDTYNIPNTLLEHYKDGIYIINDNTISDDDLITYENKIRQGFIESSNYSLLPVIYRMYYILSILDDTIIKNIEFKKEILKTLIEPIEPMTKVYDIIFGPSRKMIANDKPTEFSEYTKVLVDVVVKNKFNYIRSITPFLAYDY